MTARQDAFEKDWADRHGVPAESMPQYRHRDEEGYNLPDMSRHFVTWCNAQADVVVLLPKMRPDAGRLLTTLANSIHEQYVRAIEAAGAKVAQ